MSDKKPLREALKGFFEEDGLTDQELAQLRKVTHMPNREAAHSRNRRALLAGLGATAASIFLTARFYDMRDSDTIEQSMANEVLTNHLKIKALDIETDSIEELRRFFKELDFSPYFSSYIKSDELRLLGGRYCTLQGVVASQLRLLSPNGDTMTYYQALYDKEHFGQIPDITLGSKPSVIYTQGFEMMIWKERSVVNVFAQPT